MNEYSPIVAAADRDCTLGQRAQRESRLAACDLRLAWCFCTDAGINADSRNQRAADFSRPKTASRERQLPEAAGPLPLGAAAPVREQSWISAIGKKASRQRRLP